MLYNCNRIILYQYEFTFKIICTRIIWICIIMRINLQLVLDWRQKWCDVANWYSNIFRCKLFAFLTVKEIAFWVSVIKLVSEKNFAVIKLPEFSKVINTGQNLWCLIFLVYSLYSIDLYMMLILNWYPWTYK